MNNNKKHAGDPDWKDPDLREESKPSGLKTDFPLSEKDEFQKAIIRTKKAHERVEKKKRSSS